MSLTGSLFIVGVSLHGVSSELVISALHHRGEMEDELCVISGFPTLSSSDDDIDYNMPSSQNKFLQTYVTPYHL